MQRLVINLRLCLFFKLRIAVNGDLNTAITSPRLAESQRADGCTTLRKRTGPRLQSPRWGRTGSSGRVCRQCLSLPCSYATRLLRAFAQPNLTQEGLSIGLCPNPCANSRAHRVIVRWARGIRQGVARGEWLYGRASGTPIPDKISGNCPSDCHHETDIAHSLGFRMIQSTQHKSLSNSLAIAIRRHRI